MRTRSFEHALVLGGTGYVGLALVRQLLQDQSAPTCLTHHSLPPHWWPSDIRLLHGSITTYDWSRIGAVDVVFHLARIPGRGKTGRIVAALRSSYANRRLLRWLHKQSKPPLLILVAGTLAYGSHGDATIDEDTPLSPTSFAKEYSIGERPIVHALAEQTLPIKIMRPAWVYGPGSWFKTYYLDPIREHGHIPLYGSAQNWMSFIHVDDCAGLISHVSKCGPTGETFNVFCGTPVRQCAFAEALSELYGRLTLKKLSLEETKSAYSRAVAEAFAFSLKVGTKHTALVREYSYRYPDLKEGLREVLGVRS